jgi:hypothetical protein
MTNYISIEAYRESGGRTGAIAQEIQTASWGDTQGLSLDFRFSQS